MDTKRFDRWSRQMVDAASRRRFMRVMGGSDLAALVAWPLVAIDTSAKRKRRKKRKRKSPHVKPNAFGCLNVGDACGSENQCCSGICEGMKGRKRCQAHDSGDCQAGQRTGECGGTDDLCTTSSGQQGLCGTTTGNAGYCLTYGLCHECQTDTDCQVALDGALGATAACIQCTACTGTSRGTACVLSAPFAGIGADHRIG